MACILTLRMVEVFCHKPFCRKEIQAMKKNSTVLGNLLSHLPRSDFERAVAEHDGDLRVRTLRSWDLLRGLIYGQLTGAFSVREIETSLAVHTSRLYRVGLKPIKRSTLCDAMEKRDSRIFEKTFQALVAQAQQIAGKSGRRFRNPLKIIDASTIELCLARFEWAKFRSTKGAVKLHVELNGDHCFPEQVRLTTGEVPEVKELSNFALGKGEIVVMDRGYIDYNRLYNIDLAGSTFVTRMKDNCRYEVEKKLAWSQTRPIRFDAIVSLTSQNGIKNYPKELRRITYYDEEYGREYIFMTNNFDLTAQQIADIYKARWQVELFFKWLKQNLKIRTFWGTSPNAVFTQIWIALIVFMLLWINKTLNSIVASTQRILQVLKTSLLNKSTIADLFREPAPPDRPDPSQLCLQGFKN
jgi:putative transposase